MLEVKIAGELYYLDNTSLEVQLWVEQVRELPQFDAGLVLADWFAQRTNEYVVEEQAAAYAMALDIGLMPEI